DRGADDGRAPLMSRPSQDRQVVGLGPATREDDLGRSGSEQSGDPRPGLLQLQLGVAPPAVDARRVAERLPEQGEHRFADFWSDRSRRGVVEVDRFHTLTQIRGALTRTSDNRVTPRSFVTVALRPPSRWLIHARELEEPSTLP